MVGAGVPIEIRNPEGALDFLNIQSLAGDDRITAQGLAAGLIRLQVEGGPGNDHITGSLGADALVGGEDNDTFVWPLGSPADLMGGDGGTDTLQVIGSAAAAVVSLTATATEINVFDSSTGAAVVAAVEQVILQPGQGADQIFVGTTAGSTVQKVTLDLRATPTSTGGDGAADSIVVNGTNGVDNVSLAGSGGSFTISGLAPTIVIQGSEGVRDTLTLNTGAEVDVVDAQGLAGGLIRLIFRGGSSNDTLTGSRGDDLFTWFPGDGSDIIEGGIGNDTLQFSGSNIGEVLTLAANGSRLRFTRDIAAIAMDINGVEKVTLATLGGADTISFGDLSATNVRQVVVDLASNLTGGDGQPDTLQITALTTSPIGTVIGAGTMTINWGLVMISVTNVEAADRLVLQTPAGVTPPAISEPIEPTTTGAGEAASNGRQ